MKEDAFLTKSRAEWLRRFSAGGGLFILIFACVVLIAWAAEVEQQIARILPDSVAMNPVTSVVFILLGASLWLRTTVHKFRGAWNGRLPSLLGGIVALIGLMKLAQCLGGWNFHVDRLLFASRLAAHHGLPASEMA